MTISDFSGQIFNIRNMSNIALFGQWIILLSFYIQSTVNNKKTIYWIFIILLSSLVQLYFTAMLYLMYSIFKFDELLKKDKSCTIHVQFIQTLALEIFREVTEHLGRCALSRGERIHIFRRSRDSKWHPWIFITNKTP